MLVVIIIGLVCCVGICFFGVSFFIKQGDDAISKHEAQKKSETEQQNKVKPFQDDEIKRNN